MGPAKLSSTGLQPLCRIVTPVGMMGYGFNEDELDDGLRLSTQMGVPTAVILDSGSTDSGPSKLALGETTTPRLSYLRDMRKLVKAIRMYHVPLLISSAGGDGSDQHVELFLEIIREIVATSTEEALKLKVIAIYTEVEKGVVLEKLEAGKVSGCGQCVPPLTAEDVMATPTIVAQIGPEPFVQALAAHPDVDIIIGGRSYDPAPYVAFCAFHAFEQSYSPVLSLDSHVLGGFTHAGKIMECGGLCATPKSRSSLATAYADGTFDIRPLARGALCTPASVAAHTLYEKSRPDRLQGPGGSIDLTAATYTPLSDGISVRVRGTVFQSSKADGGAYTVKLEGAKIVGYRTMFIGSFVDPVLISQLDALLTEVKQHVTRQHQDIESTWDLQFHVYGLDKTGKQPVGRDVFIVGEALAENQALASSLAAAAKIGCVHGPYKGQKATSGNFGMGLGGASVIETGPCSEFSVYHLMDLNEKHEEAVEIPTDHSIKSLQRRYDGLFRWQMLWIGDGERIASLPITQDPGVAEAPLEPKPQSHDEQLRSSSKIGDFITLGDAAKFIRSKNAGPYEITFDIMFDDLALYEEIKRSGILSRQVVADLYKISLEDVIYCGFFDPAMAFKATIPRYRGGKPTASGGYMENDVHGSQQYMPLWELKLNAEI